jgi:type VI secretion system protein VasD
MHTTTLATGTATGVSFVRVLRGVARTGLVVVLAACAGPPPPPKPTVVAATLQASANVNPDAHKRASPLVVRIYELKSSAAFDAADFLSLYERDQATLAAEMGAREEFTLRPGDSKPWEKTVGPEVRFIGVIAAFRDIERARWKALVPVKANLRNVVTIRADEITIAGSVATQ